MVKGLFPLRISREMIVAFNCGHETKISSVAYDAMSLNEKAEWRANFTCNACEVEFAAMAKTLQHWDLFNEKRAREG